MQSFIVNMKWLARSFAITAFWVLLSRTGFANEDAEAESSVKARLDVAKIVYRHLLERHRSGESGGVESIESLARWSERIAALEAEKASAEVDAASSGLSIVDALQQKTRQTLRKHIERMQALAEHASARVDAGVASTAERAAARYFALEAEFLPEKLAALQQVQEERELDVVLPPASEAQPLTLTPKELFVNIDAKGDVLVDGEKLTTQQLEKVLASYREANPVAARVIIRADGRTHMEKVIKVMNLCNRYVPDYSLTIKPD